MNPGVSARQMSMAKLITGMTVSLDGFVADREGNADALYPDLAALQDTPYMEAMAAETGAVLMGRGAFEMAEDADAYADSYELQRPIFVVTHQPPDKHPKGERRADLHVCHRWPRISGRAGEDGSWRQVGAVHRRSRHHRAADARRARR